MEVMDRKQKEALVLALAEKGKAYRGGGCILLLVSGFLGR
jgi:hypothetical protein